MQNDRILQCSVCLETMKKPIIQCENGHSMCEACKIANNIATCPQCRGKMTNIRCYPLEQIIETMKIPCFFSENGCTFKSKSDTKELHEKECKHRLFTCEGKKFCKWNCNWMGKLDKMFEHYKKEHNSHMEFTTKAVANINFDSDYADIQMISFRTPFGTQYFWYKHKVDIAERTIYWVFQFIGPKTEANKYFYEFEIYNGPIRKLKITEICENDVEDVQDLFKKGKCVKIGFDQAKNFFNDDDELMFKYRIMVIKKSP